MKNKSEWTDINKKKPKSEEMIDVHMKDGNIISGCYEGLLEKKDCFVITAWLPNESSSRCYSFYFDYAKYWRYSNRPKKW